jgi:hypothetical protein
MLTKTKAHTMLGKLLSIAQLTHTRYSLQFVFSLGAVNTNEKDLSDNSETDSFYSPVNSSKISETHNAKHELD